MLLTIGVDYRTWIQPLTISLSSFALRCQKILMFFFRLVLARLEGTNI